MNANPASPPKNWRRIRKNFCFLPLQISHFDQLGAVHACLLPANNLRTPGRAKPPIGIMTREGHIFLDDATFKSLTEQLQQDLSLRQAKEIRNTHQRQLNILQRTVHQAAVFAKNPINLSDWAPLWCATADAVAALVPYALMTKLLSPVLLARVGSSKANSAVDSTLFAGQTERFPMQLTSTTLVNDLQALANCLARLSQGDSRKQIDQFCRTHLGHGPKPWELPGCEDHGYVLNLVDAISSQETPISRPATWAQNHNWQARNGWERELAYWTRHLDAQTTLLRWAFLTAELPLLLNLGQRQVESGKLAQTSDLLFCTRQEVGSEIPPGDVLKQRRRRYQDTMIKAGQSDLINAPDRRMNSGWPTAVPADAGSGRFPVVVPAKTTSSLQGKSVACREKRTGPARPIFTQSPPFKDPPGGVIIAQHLAPDMTPALLSADAVVVEEGGVLQHAAIVARELNIVCIVGCQGVMSAVSPGMRVTVDGQSGRVWLQPEHK